MKKVNKLNLYMQFKASRGVNKGEGTIVRTNVKVLNHVCAALSPYYPEISIMNRSEKANFLVFLLEKSLIDRLPDYVESWNWQQSPSGAPFNDQKE